MFKWLIPERMRIHPSGILSVRLKGFNKKIVFRTNQTNYLTKLLFWNREKDFEYTQIFMELIKKFETFIDVGANIGYYSILGAKINPNLNVISFEPSVGPMIYLSENIRINKLEEQISVEVIALSDQIGKVDFNEIRNKKFPSIYNLSGEHNLETKPDKAHHKIKVESDTLDRYTVSKNLAKIDLIKLDTEGNENKILIHSHKTIQRYRPIIICETLFNTIEDSLEEIMSKHNYSFYKRLKRVSIVIKSTNLNSVYNRYL